MLPWSKGTRIAVWAVAALLFGVAYALPLAMIALASITRQWNGILPSSLTMRHFVNAVQGDSGAQLWASVMTGLAASLIALVCGSWAALALRGMKPAPRRLLDMALFVPSAVPSVSVGLGLLVAFSRPPLLLNGTVAIVLIAHFVLISAFTYGNVSAGLARIGPEFEQIAACLGARPAYVLRCVTLPLLAPYLVAAFSLSFALSMGELGATIMVYPPGWVTLPVGIYALTDRGEVFAGATLTVLLAVTTLAVLIGLTRLGERVSGR